MNEEIVVKFGADSSPLERSLTKLKHTVGEWGESVGETIHHAFSHLAAPLSVAGIIATFHHVLEKVKEIKRASESLAISPQFYQGIVQVAKASGIGSENLEKMLDKFVKGLPIGSDVEQRFYAIADSIKEIEDPSERARMATDAFGKQGVKLISVLAKGSDGIKEMAKQFSVLSDAELESIEQAEHKLQQFSNRMTVLAGKTLGFVQKTTAALIANLVMGIPMSDISKFAAEHDNEANASAKKARDDQRTAAQKEASEKQHKADIDSLLELKAKQEELDFEKMSDTQKITALQKKQKEALENASGTMLEETRNIFAKKALDIEEKILKIKEKQKKEAEKIQEEEAKSAKHAYDAALASDKAIGDIGKFSVSELANRARAELARQQSAASGWSHGGPGINLPQSMWLALQSENELRMTQESEVAGNRSGADFHRGKYLEAIRRNPALSSSEKAIVENASAAKELLRLAAGPGVAIIPRNGE